MGFFDKLKKSKGGYIFLSHSHDDIETVRKLRNYLEADGFEPLCFYLKCLDDDSEIEDLIKREIDAREWFVFVDSENARKSRWVTLEREYITRTDSKKIITVNIEDSNSIAEIVYKISHNLRVFISYSHKDEVLARRIKAIFEEKDYLVFFAPDSIPLSGDYAEIAANAITEAAKDGCVIALITPDSLKSRWVRREIDFAAHQGGNIIPIVVGDFKHDRSLYHTSEHMPQYHLPENPTEEEIYEIIDQIGRHILQKT